MWNFLLDCVTISVNGLSLDALIAELTRNNIKQKNITRRKRTEMHITIYGDKYNDFVRIANKHGASYSVIKRRGTKNSIMKAAARPIMLIGSLVVLLGVIFANYYVISVNYSIDADEETTKELIDYCSDLGVYKGAYKKNWDIDNMELSIYLNVDNISYVSIKDTGSTIEVEAVEETQNAIDRNRSEMANVYALKSCLIHEITLYNGKCLVEAGDVVQKGQLLVSGNMPINNDTGVIPMGADADIIGRVWYTASVERYLYDEVNVRNSLTAKNIIVKANDIVLFSTNRKLDNYESEYIEYNLFKGIIPITYIVEYQFGVDTKRVDISLESAKNNAEALALQKAGINIGEQARIINTWVNTTAEDDKIIAQATIETNELISKRIIQE